MLTSAITTISPTAYLGFRPPAALVTIRGQSQPSFYTKMHAPIRSPMPSNLRTRTGKVMSWMESPS